MQPSCPTPSQPLTPPPPRCPTPLPSTVTGPPRPDLARAFLYVESLDGAVALLLHPHHLADWAGLVLNGAMCAVSDKFKQLWPLEHLLWVVAAVAPTWDVVPMRWSIPGVSFKVGWKRRLATASPRQMV